MFKFHITSAIAAALAFAAAFPAHALTIDWSQLTEGTNFVDNGDWSATASPRDFKHKTVNGQTGAGIAGGAVDGEIDINGESITITFATPQQLSSITLGFLFQAGNFGDTVSEVARLQISAAPFVAGDLSVISPNSATWSGPGGSVANDALGDESGAGLWTILDPFGGLEIGWITLSALQVGAPPPAGSPNSDFSFVSLSTATAVPEPMSAGLLAVALAGFAGLRRRA